MERQALSARIKATIVEQIEAIVDGSELTRSQVIERLLEIALEQGIGYVDSRTQQERAIMSTEVDISLTKRVEALEEWRKETEDYLQSLDATVYYHDEKLSPFISESEYNSPPVETSSNLGLSDSELAQKLGKSKSTVNRWRNGKRRMPEDLEWEVKGDKWIRKA